jgi:hypothetical protein
MPDVTATSRRVQTLWLEIDLEKVLCFAAAPEWTCSHTTQP